MIRKLKYIIFISVVVLLGFARYSNAAENQQSNVEIKDGVYEIETALQPGKVIDVIGAQTKKGANVQIYDRNNADCQKVRVKHVGSGYYTIQFVHSGKFLDVCGEGKVNGTNVWQWDQNGCDAQKWKIQKNADGYFSLYAKCSGTCLTVKNDKSSNFTNIEINTFVGKKGQKFKFCKYEQVSGKQTIANGTYEIVTALNANKAIDVIGARANTGANVQIYDRNNADCQKVKVQYENGYYTMQFIHSGKFLDVCGEGKVNGTNVWQWNKNGCDAQKWVIQPTGDRIL